MKSNTQSVLLKHAFLFTLLNVPLTIAVFIHFFLKASEDTGISVPINLLMLLSDVFLLSLLPLLFLSLLLLVVRNKVTLSVIAAIVFSIFQAFLIADYKVFQFFKFHINGLVINFLTTEGAGDSLSLGSATLTTAGLVFFLILSFEFYLAVNVFIRGNFANIRLRPKMIAAAIFILLVADKAVFAYADLTNRTSVLSSARYYPYYPKVTVKRFASRWLGMNIDRRDSVSLSASRGTLNYPLEPLKFRTGAPKYNIVFIIVDGLRADMLRPEVMPWLSTIARESIFFRNHYSGGNGTRFGIFSLFYGIYGNLWHSFLEARQGPVFIDALIEQGYQFTILSSTRLTFPEFRKTVFSRVQDSIYDEHAEEENYKRDAILVEKFSRFLAQRDRKRPFMGFMFFNSSHQFYDYPPEFERFTPVITDGINYAENIDNDKIKRLRNRYRNSLFYIDHLIHSTVQELKTAGVFKDTILVVTGDHGEEFMENGYFSHNAAFDDYQIKTPLVMRIPGMGSRVVEGLTSHLDVVPTILNIMGCTTQVSSYAHGNDLFSGEGREYVFSSDWSRGAIVTEQMRFIIPLGTRGGAVTEMRTGLDYRPVNDKDTIRLYSRHGIEVAKRLGLFLR